MISSKILNEVIDMHVRASEIKDLSRVMILLIKQKNILKIMILTNGKKDILTLAQY